SNAPPCLSLSQGADILAVARRHALAVLACGDDAAALSRGRRVAAELAGLCGAAPRRGLKILLAEDNAVNGRVLAKLLAGAGHEARVVGDGEAALLAMLREKFDVVLLDVNMPRLGGVETARIYAAAGGGAAMLALTADDSAEIRRRCRAAGMVDCLCKPIAPEALAAAVAMASAGRRSEAQGVGESEDAAAPRGAELEAAAMDAATLAALGRLGGAEFLRELLVQFAGDAARLVEELQESLARGDMSSLLRQAHALESMAGNMGAAALVKLCRAWRAMNEKKLALSAARESGRLRRRWRMTLDAVGRALAQA
ncbi:response regulator, partial [Rhodoblastus acidophilus]